MGGEMDNTHDPLTCLALFVGKDDNDGLVQLQCDQFGRVITSNAEDVIDRLERIENGIEELHDAVNVILALMKHNIPRPC
jgi:hypothetical protein